MGTGLMRTVIISGTLLLFIAFANGYFGEEVHADTIQELETKQSNIQKEREEIKKGLSEAEAEIADLLLDLKEINEEIVQLEEALKHNEAMLTETEEEIEELEKEIQALQVEIDELVEKIETRNEILKQRITAYQKSGGNIRFLQVLFGAKSFSDFISRVNAVTKITNSDMELIKEQEEDKQEVEEAQNKLNEVLEEQEEKLVELKGIEELILEQKDQTEKKQKKLKKQEKKLKKKKSELESEDDRLSSLEAQVRREISMARNAAIQAALATQRSQGNNTSPINTLSNNDSPNIVQGSGNLSTVVNAGMKYLGTPYRWGGTTPAGFDCSGFVSWAYAQAGYRLPSHTKALAQTGRAVSKSEMKPGDIVFFDNTYSGAGRNSHVGIYIGNGQFIGAQSNGLWIESMNSSYWSRHFSGHVRRIQ